MIYPKLIESEERIEYHYKKWFWYILHEEFFFNEKEFKDLLTNIWILKKQYHWTDRINRNVIGNLRMIETELMWTYQRCDKYNKPLDNISNDTLFQHIEELNMATHNLLFDITE